MSDPRETGTTSRWLDAMQAGERYNLEQAEAANAGGTKKRRRSALETASGSAGRMAGSLSKVARENRKAERAAQAAEREAAREHAKQIKPRNDKPRVERDDKLRLKETLGHITFDSTEVWAWYVVAGVSLGFSPIDEIESTINSDAVAYAALQGRRIRVRTSTRPYSVRQWARDTYDDAKAAGNPVDAFGNVYLPNTQRHMQAMSFSEKFVYLGVRISTYRSYSNDAPRELNHLRSTIEGIGQGLATSSLRTTPATPEDMEWLIRRSVALGLPMPRIGAVANYEREDIPELEAMAHWTGDPMRKHITVSGKVPGVDDELEMKVTVLTLGRLSDQAIPQQNQTGWMQRTDKLGFPVEWVATIDVVPEEKTQNWIRGRMDLIRDQMKHYVDEHQIEAPPSLNRQLALGSGIQGELESDHGGSAIRTVGWYRVAISAPNEKLLSDRVAKAKQVYGARADLVETPNQYHCAREFIPNEPLATTAHRRRMSVVTLGAAIPHGTAEVGDRCGITLGYTAGSAMRAVAWHPHWDMELRHRSGLLICAGGLGSGKTNVSGWIVAQSAMSGVQWSVLDPSDRLGRLCKLPELEGHTRYINLMKGRAGELSPYRVVAEPRREHFPDGQEGDVEWEREISDAQGTRRSLMNDILYSFLTRAQRENPVTDSVLTRALEEVPPLRDSSPTQVLTALEKIANGEIHNDLQSEHRIKARDLVYIYNRIAQTPTGKLIFPPADAPPLDEFEEDDVLLTVYTLNGMAVPSEQDIAMDKIDERTRLSMSIMTLAAWLVQSRIYLGSPSRRKGLLIDEGKTITSLSAGKTLMTKTATDSRKFNLRAILCSQNVTHFDVDSSSVDSLSNLVGAALIGHTEGEIEAAAALKILRAPVGQGYEAILKTLRPPKQREQITRDLDGKMVSSTAEDDSPRHFIFWDGRHSPERIVIDLSSFPALKAALDSRPGAYDTPVGEKEGDAA